MRNFRLIGLLSAMLMVVSTASAAAAAPPGTGSAAPAAVRLSASSVNWSKCSAASGLLGVARAQCAMLAVPLDYAKPHGATIELAISRVRHSVPAAQFQGIMLVNPGGPGGSGLSLSTLGADVPDGVGNDYDWIGFDPRGVGSSVPAVSCDTSYFNFDRPNYIPRSAADLRVWLDRSRGYASDCAHKNGPILDHMTTIDSARDMDSIRKALGAAQINYYGFSYGTYLGQVYSTLFPHRVRREVLDSNVDPRHIWYPANLSQDLAFNRNIKIWFGWLAKYDAVYHLGATETKVQDLFYRIRGQLAVHPADGKIGADEWTDAFVFAAYYQETWLEEGAVLAGYVNHHDVKDLEQEYANDEGLGTDNEFAAYNATECTDVTYPTDVAATVAQNRRYAQRAPFLTWDNYWFNGPCLYWPARAHATTPFRVNGDKVASALLVDETLDAATPYEGSLYVRSVFPHASLIALPGGTSHADSLFGDACEDNHIAAYLRDGSLPARKPGNGPDTLCAPLPRPIPSAQTPPTALTHLTLTGRDVPRTHRPFVL